MTRRITLSALLALLLTSSAFAWGGNSVPQWLKELAKAELPNYPDDTPGVALLDSTITTVGDNGSVRTVHRRAYRILNSDGKDLGYARVYFDNATPISGFYAWSITPSGEEYQAKERDAVESAAFDGELYADNRIKVVRIPGAVPGSIVAFEYEQVERPAGLQSLWDLSEERAGAHGPLYAQPSRRLDP